MVKPGSLAFPGGGARHLHGVPFLSAHDFAWPGGWALPPFMTPPLASDSVTPTPHGSHEVPPRVKAHRADLEKCDLHRSLAQDLIRFLQKKLRRVFRFPGLSLIAWHLTGVQYIAFVFWRQALGSV